jgi:hypothetical protein
MENQIIENSIIEQEIKKSFNYGKRARWLLFISIVGMILSVAYFYITTDVVSNCYLDFAGTCVKGDHESLVIKYQSLYYGITAFMFLISSLFLLKKNKLGIVLFFIGTGLIILSIFINVDFKIDLMLFHGSLFGNSLFSALGSFIVVGGFYGILIAIGVLMYFLVIISNLLSIRKWRELVK